MAGAFVVDEIAKEVSINIKDEQLECILQYLHGRDAMLIAPTGYGKSLVFQLAPQSFSRVSLLPIAGCSVLIISPLNSLISDNISQLAGLYPSLPALQLTPDCVAECSLTANYVFATPEAMMSDTGRKYLLSAERRLKAVFVDECHCITQW
jgi:ATP-dependent DNA helicase RecQ